MKIKRSHGEPTPGQINVTLAPYWTRTTRMVQLEEKIISSYPEQAKEEYYKLSELYYEKLQDYEALVTNPGTDAEIPQKLKADYEQIERAYFNNEITQAVNKALAESFPDNTKYDDLFIDALQMRGRSTPELPEDARKLSRLIYEHETLIKIELAQNPDKYKGYKPTANTEATEEPQKITRNELTIENLILFEWLDPEGNEKPDGLLFKAIKAAEINKKNELCEIQEKKTDGVYVSVLKDLYLAHIGVDKSYKNIVGILPEIKTIDGQITMLWVTNLAKKNQNLPIPVYISMYLPDDIKAKKRITAEDETVHDAIVTLYYMWMEKFADIKGFYFTTEEVWRAKNGFKDDSKNPSPKQREEVEKSIEKLASIRLDMDISNEIQARYIEIDDERVVKGKIKTNILHVTSVEVETIKGRIISAHKLIEEPIFYTYQKAKDQVLSVKYDLLDTSDETGNEGNTAEIRRYLLREIEQMYNGTRDNNSINLESMYKSRIVDAPQERAGERERFKNERAYKTSINKIALKDREKITGILRSWKKKGYIDDFAGYPANAKSIKGYKVILNEEILKEHKKIKKS